ncbi:MAG: hypothetical protein KAS62_06590, partial [Candidatus Delongbacteria bacterium]|nr:hypothetical protein [Candidatus Delongbacteria bacterium]
MKNYRKIFLLVLISVSLAFAGQIGPWSHFKAVTSNFTVNAGDTLTINAGTEVRFSQGTIMTIFGVVLSNGTSSDPVIFAALDPANPSWGGITIKNTDPLQISVFNSTIFTKMYSYGDGAINIEESSVNFNNCKFLDNHADVHGGAVYAVAGNVNFITCIFKNNNANQGGGIYVYNNPVDAASTINISKCTFLNNSATDGGAVYVEDFALAAFDMIMVIENSGFHYNKAGGGNGGGLFFNVLSHLDLTFRFCKIQYNVAFSGGGIYAKFNEMSGENVLPQKFTNLLISENTAPDGSGFYFNSGLTQNPMAFIFENTTIAYNYLNPSKGSKEIGGGGIHIVSNNNYPIIKNSIIWANGNELWLDQFMIEDDTFPDPNLIFGYCDIDGEQSFGIGGISEDPVFVRPPKPLAVTGDITIVDADRFD